MTKVSRKYVYFYILSVSNKPHQVLLHAGVPKASVEDILACFHDGNGFATFLQNTQAEQQIWWETLFKLLDASLLEGIKTLMSLFLMTCFIEGNNKVVDTARTKPLFHIRGHRYRTVLPREGIRIRGNRYKVLTTH